MSNFGVLVVESAGSYQILGEVSSRAEALETAANYLTAAIGHEDDFLAPEAFVVNRRDSQGWYTRREHLADEDVATAQDILGQMSRCEKLIRRGSYGDARIQLDLLSTQLASLGGAR